jgi:hypothetical protein
MTSYNRRDGSSDEENVTQRSGLVIAGCTYHVTHPGGWPTRVPVNANELESIRLARFQTPVTHWVRWLCRPEERNPEFPLTLDLRRTRGPLTQPPHLRHTSIDRRWEGPTHPNFCQERWIS